MIELVKQSLPLFGCGSKFAEGKQHLGGRFQQPLEAHRRKPIDHGHPQLHVGMGGLAFKPLDSAQRDDRPLRPFHQDVVEQQDARGDLGPVRTVWVVVGWAGAHERLGIGNLLDTEMLGEPFVDLRQLKGGLEGYREVERQAGLTKTGKIAVYIFHILTGLMGGFCH